MTTPEPGARPTTSEPTRGEEFRRRVRPIELILDVSHLAEVLELIEVDESDA